MSNKSEFSEKDLADRKLRLVVSKHLLQTPRREIRLITLETPPCRRTIVCYHGDKRRAYTLSLPYMQFHSVERIWRYPNPECSIFRSFFSRFGLCDKYEPHISETDWCHYLTWTPEPLDTNFLNGAGGSTVYFPLFPNLTTGFAGNFKICFGQDEFQNTICPETPLSAVDLFWTRPFSTDCWYGRNFCGRTFEQGFDEDEEFFSYWHKHSIDWNRDLFSRWPLEWRTSFESLCDAWSRY